LLDRFIVDLSESYARTVQSSMSNSAHVTHHWKGLRGDDRNDLLQLFDRRSIATFHQPSSFSESRSKNWIMPEGSISAR
jgi:hypothetical protein